MKDEIDWTTEMINDLTIEFDKGLSMAQIAKALALKYENENKKLTRNAVLGKLHRLRMRRIKEAALPKPKKVKDKKRRPPLIAHHQAPRFKWVTEPPGIFRCSIEELTADRCHWPMGEMQAGPPFVYCGASVSKRSYCHYHYLLSLRHKENI